MTKIKNAIAFILMVFVFTAAANARQTDRKIAFTAKTKDGSAVPVYLYHLHNMPGYFYAYLTTPVCEEGICYNISIGLYWDLLGNFSKYELPPDSLLTKFDHQPFTPQDHEKMYSLLKDKSSPLGIYEAEDLVDREASIPSRVKVDVVTGATNPSLKNAVVSGAVYSSHTLWHIVNGPIAERIARYTDSLMNKQLLNQFMLSDNYHYQYYALEKIQNAEVEQYIPQLIRLVSSGSAYIPYFAIAKLPDKVWQMPKYQEQLVAMMPRLDFKLQNEMLGHLKDVTVSQATGKMLKDHIKLLKGQQVQKALDIIKKQEIFTNQ
ncbi:hypothetical protein ABIE26_001526 [Pedobacter africanus]|uniref:Uncharacterized protein n=1 Tax=Pedobacter africanus TaxID=151894 RepID=A0ACC6KS19_9SPHI|nr:hypothetical protein [Pedobacter africanus]MDR6781985.1 hypothetical protein [Pedobacter africanus]